MSATLREFIDDGRVHVIDGAMGTMLYGKGMFVNVCYDELNLTQPDVVQQVHEAYIQAGASIIETNTFGANPVKLSSHGLDTETEKINQAAAQIARNAAPGHVCVVGAIGPLGIRIEPWGPTAREEAEEFFRRQVRGLLDGGVDGFMLETFSDLDEIHAAYRAVRGLSSLPVIAQMTIDESGRSAYGTDVERIATALTDFGADVVGLNCSVGPAVMLDGIERMAEVTDRPLSALPNAGLPRSVGDRKIYLSSPEYMANYAQRMIRAGARFVGGCCGTTPEHIKKIRDLVATMQPRQQTVVVTRSEVEAPAGVEPVPLAERSHWGEKLATGGFLTNVELMPPKGCQPDTLIEQCRTLKHAGVDAVSILDGPRAQSRMGAIPAGITVQRDVGIETVIHYTCRDRNMLGMISDLLGAAAAGLRNILIVTGDPPRTGPYPDSTAVFDIDSIGLTNVVYRLNHGLDPGGNPIGAPTKFVIGVALNQSAVDVERELSRLAWKVDAGAEFAVTQPVFDPDQLAAFLERVEGFRLPVIAGIWPLLSLRNAEFLANEVPGQQVPRSVINRMRKAQERGQEAARAEGILIAREILEAVRDTARGVHVSAPLGKVDVALQVVADRAIRN
ncbi:MAG: bifunctional homocysteine S-methyltransferase/methylenetetrahydrofolate reductase [Gemmatimonadales bacterium]|nr:bifunctional homocysteine S-methyltransferase/methylenetetrahydrofolate reductase [Gemmatimonadales bacterium]NIN10606.1 bifunctional homocysteine S-methyltransferase/methylenetetrahydrofolate reductase [Gemmatimonadales bacterium]NIN49368.1 bifunctional homocysteine S-methyltransferase/methylenetetrahydrofolate reductase [Gemmatimonadales bacterium]NIP06832.1 bifunctional homocysteine S-methyltransferase/methylenetetrahydrofolate reductase [Gemmatimonadales bacterium]NIR01506.1 bifunctional